MNIPDNLWYSKTHEWVLFIDGKARIGLTDYAQDSLGDIVYVNLPAVGDEATVNGAVCEVESVKAVSDVLSPVGGTISAVNHALEDAPESINASPYDAWIVEIDGITGKEDLLSPDRYEAFCREETPA